jgi:hypothetical protein
MNRHHTHTVDCGEARNECNSLDPRRSACIACDDAEGFDATYRCPGCAGTVDSDGRLYCVRCGHAEPMHPVGRRPMGRTRYYLPSFVSGR